MKHIPLTQNKFALVDDKDYEYLMQWKWFANKLGKTYYAVRSFRGESILMHRVITSAPKGKDIDHKDRDGLNNQRSNLRVCSKAENQMNRDAPITNTSGYKGVSFVKQDKKFRARIIYNKKRNIFRAF